MQSKYSSESPATARDDEHQCYKNIDLDKNNMTLFRLKTLICPKNHTAKREIRARKKLPGKNVAEVQVLTIFFPVGVMIRFCTMRGGDDFWW